LNRFLFGFGFFFKFFFSLIIFFNKNRIESKIIISM
jgi:hypothetical protein